MSSAWDSVTDRGYCRFTDEVVVVMFESGEPTKTINKYGQPQYDFDVEGNLLFGVSSKSLMRLLKKYRPLAGRTFKITRSGHDFDTIYQVDEVTP